MSRKTRKLIWSAPLVAVLAVAGALAIFAALGPNQAQADHESLPSAPINLLATPADGNAGRTELVVTWTAPTRGPVTGYRIDYSLDNIEYKELVANSESTATTYTHTGLKPGTLYVYRVFAINSSGVGLVSETYSSMTDGVADRPDDVIGLTAAPATTTPEKWSEINLNWTEPYDGGSDITGYCIETVDDGLAWPGATTGCRTSTVPTTNTPFDAGTAAGVTLTGNTMTTYTDDGLNAEERRYYRVFAITGEGNDRAMSEMPSNEAHAMTADPVKPDAPTGLRVAKASDDATAINLYWYWPASDGGNDIINFRVEVTTNRNSWPKATEAQAADEDNNITANPFAGGNLTATGATANDNGVLDAVTAATASDNAVAQQGAHAHAVPIAAGQKTLYYRVSTQTAAGRSVHSNVASVIVNGGITPVAPTFAETNVAAGDGKIDLTWSAADYDHDGDGGTTPEVPYPASGYRIDYAEGKADTPGSDTLMWKPLWGNTGFTDTEFTHEPLKPSTRAYYRIFTIGSNQVISIATGPFRGTTEVAGALGKVRNLQAMADNSTKITATWDPPQNLGVHEIDHYSVQMVMRGVIPSTFDAVETETTMGAAETFMHTNLSENQTWLYRVAAVAKGRTTDLTEAEYTSWVNATTPAAGKPEAPVGLVAEDARDSSLTAPGDRGVLLIWNEPKGPVGSIVTEYEVQRMVMGEDSNFKALTTLTATLTTDGGILVPARTSFTDDDEPDLDDDEVRHYRVRAVSNTDVDGEWATVRFPADRTHNNAPTAGAAIADKSVQTGATAMVQSTITDPDGDSLTWAWTSSATAIATVEADSADMSMATITGEAEGTATITVTATDGDGASAMQTITVTVTAAMLTAPTNVMAEAIDADDPGGPLVNDVRVTWRDGQGADRHIAVLFDSNWEFGNRVATHQTDGSVIFSDVPSGEYVAAVIAIEDNEDGNAEAFLFATRAVTVP